LKAQRRLLPVICAALLGVFLAASAILLRFEFWGPFRLILPIHSPLNAESAIAVSFLLLTGLRFSPSACEQPETGFGRSQIRPISVIIAVGLLSFAATIDVPLLYDSYGHVAHAARETLHDVLRSFFEHPQAGDFFFRPLGYLNYWLDFKWAGYNAFRWHLCNLIIHVLNSLLVYVLAQQLSLSRPAAMVAGLIFAAHGSRPEVVSWMAARFDLLAAFFVLLSLVAFNRYLATQHSGWYWLMLICSVLALLSKESAYCLPFLLAGLIPFKDASSRKKMIKAAFALLLVCAAVFLYRYWVIRGIGGYRTQSGESTILRFSAVHAVKGLFFRQWSLLFFPINWSSDPRLWVKWSVVLLLGVMGGFLVYSQAKRKYLLASLFLVIAAGLPVQHLLLINKDLSGARVLYLPVLGISIFWGVLVQGCRQALLLTSLAGGLLVFHLVVLQHNLAIWRKAALLSQQTCRAVGEELTRTPEKIIVVGLPATWHGVFFLRNGFPECVAINSHQAADRIEVEDWEKDPAGHARIFVWNSITDRLEEK
jgi:Dolichyl-phosphate-mannose-protein mannosyltransferase